MSQQISHFALLVQLAKADKQFDQKEASWLESLGSKLGLSPEEIREAFQQPGSTLSTTYMTQEERFEAIYNLIQLMKVDGKVLMSEIDFCKRAAESLGFDAQVVKELSAYIYSDPAITAGREALMQKAFKYLRLKVTEVV
jgi:uncharacterized tellurite resistance protein B-like protein